MTTEVVMILEMMAREITTLIGMKVHPLTWDEVEPLVATQEEVATMDLQEEEEIVMMEAETRLLADV